MADGVAVVGAEVPRQLVEDRDAASRSYAVAGRINTATTLVPRRGFRNTRTAAPTWLRSVVSGRRGGTMPYRVVQWTTGNVGVQSVKAILDRPDLELVGCYAWSDDKVGRDVGELCGLDPVGIAATNDVDALLALQPDCVVYNPMWLDVDEMVRILDVGRQHRVDRGVRHRPLARRRPAPHRRRLRARRRVDVRHRHQSWVRRPHRDPGRRRLQPHRQDHRHRDRRLDRLRLPRHRDPRRFRTTHRRPEPAGDDPPRHRGVRGRGSSRRRRDRRRVRRDRVRGRVRTDDPGPRSRLLEDRRRVCGRRRRELAGPRRRPHDRRPARAVAQGPDPRPRLGDARGLPDPDRRAADDHDADRHPAAARLPGDAVRGLHGARHDPHRDAGDQRDPARRRGATRDRDVQRPSPAPPAQRRGPRHRIELHDV